MSKDDGGPAFPQPTNEGLQFDGMSLRDWFAGQVLAGVMSRDGLTNVPEMICADVYILADAMLAARSKGPSND